MSWTQPAFEAVANLVGERTGLSFANRQGSAELGMRRAMTRAKVTDLPRYLDLIGVDERALDDLVSELTVAETYFFREPGQFEVLRRQVLPEIRQRRGPEHMIRAWSAACASGEEAYSLAVLVEQVGLADRLHLLATDISQRALAKAREAVYGDWSLRGEQGTAALPYLIHTKHGYRLDERIRRRVIYQPLNLALDVYPSFANGTWGMDLILCRNVLIYFDAQTVRRVARRLYQALADGGWLITAAADPPLWQDAPFEVVATEEGIFYRRAAMTKVPSDEIRDIDLPLKGTQGEGRACASSGQKSDPEALQSVAAAEFPDGRGKAATEETSRMAALFRDAAQAFARGDYARVVEMTQDQSERPTIPALHVRALANIDLAKAEKACARALVHDPLSAELNFLHALVLLDLGRGDEAVPALRRVIYLDRSLAVAHLALGSILQRRGDPGGAKRAYRNARDLCANRPADEVVPLADGETAGRLAKIAGLELALLQLQG